MAEKNNDIPVKWIAGYEGLYQVDIYGNIRSIKRNTTKGGIMKPQNAHGYYRVALTKNGKTKRFFVHRIVAEAFIPNPENLPQVNHKDENKRNNYVENLEWCTMLYNVRYGTGIKRQSIARTGVPFTEERRRKMSEANKGKKPPVHTDSGRKRMSEAAKKRWEQWRLEHGR